jgi:hypothetical protein
MDTAMQHGHGMLHRGQGHAAWRGTCSIGMGMDVDMVIDYYWFKQKLVEVVAKK